MQVAGSPTDRDLTDRYERYLALCNAHAFDQLGGYVAADVVVVAFPDYRWQVRHLVVKQPVVAVHPSRPV